MPNKYFFFAIFHTLEGWYKLFTTSACKSEQVGTWRAVPHLPIGKVQTNWNSVLKLIFEPTLSLITFPLKADVCFLHTESCPHLKSPDPVPRQRGPTQRCYSQNHRSSADRYLTHSKYKSPVVRKVGQRYNNIIILLLLLFCLDTAATTALESFSLMMCLWKLTLCFYFLFS